MSRLSSGTLNLKFMQKGSGSSAKPTPTQAQQQQQRPVWRTADSKGKGKAKEPAPPAPPAAVVKAAKASSTDPSSNDDAPAAPRPQAPDGQPRIVQDTNSYLNLPILSRRHAHGSSPRPVHPDNAPHPQVGPRTLPVYLGRKSFGNFNTDVEKLGQAPAPILEPAAEASDPPASSSKRWRKDEVVTGRGGLSGFKPDKKSKTAVAPSQPPRSVPATAQPHFLKPSGFEGASLTKPSRKRSRGPDGKWKHGKTEADDSSDLEAAIQEKEAMERDQALKKQKRINKKADKRATMEGVRWGTAREQLNDRQGREEGEGESSSDDGIGAAEVEALMKGRK